MVKTDRYEAYNDSGVAWIGEIPDSWCVDRLKGFIELLTGYPFKSDQYSKSGIKLARGINVKEGYFDWRETAFWEALTVDIKKFLLRDGDILIAMDGSKVGKNFCRVIEADLPVLLLQRVARLRPNDNLLPHFLYWNIVNRSFLNWVNISKTDPMIPHIAPKDIKNFVIAIPPKQDQTRIANFLDRKTTQIDKAIAQKERLIELLKERRQIMIHEAVTKGLDKNVKMKDSGVPWIGEVPEGWEVLRAKYIFDEVDERSVEGTEELLSVSHMTGVTPRSQKEVNMFLAEDYSGSKLCKDGDLVINIMWAWMGALGVSDRVGIVSPSYGVFHQKKTNLTSWYLEHLLQDKEYVAEYNRRSTGLHSSRLRLYADYFFDMELGFPSVEEQIEIENVVISKTDKVDKALKQTETQITRLKEYRTTLIDAAVTGKIKV